MRRVMIHLLLATPYLVLRTTCSALACILLLTPSAAAQTGTITTVAGGGPDNLPALQSNIAVPTSLAVDAAGNYYVTSITQDRVFKVSPEGILTVLAGTGLLGSGGDGGPARDAMLSDPQGVAVDAFGNVYIADRSNHRIRRVDAATGIIIAVNKIALTTPTGVRFDSGGNLYMTSSGDAPRIYRQSPGADGRVTGAPDETVTLVAGSGLLGFGGDGGPATMARLGSPTDVAFDAAGNLYICDARNQRIRRVDAATGIITTVAGNGAAAFAGDGGPATSASLNAPLGIHIAAGKLYIADQFNRRVRAVDLASGIIITLAGTGVSGFSGDGGPATSARLNLPRDAVTDADGNLLISDASNNRIRRVDAAGIISTVAGNGTMTFSGEATAATNASLNSPGGIVVGSDGTLLFADIHHERIRRVDATGMISTVAGNGVWGFNGDGLPATSARLASAFGATSDSAGNVLIADSGNHRIRRVDAATGVIATVIGSGMAGFSGDDGPATAATLNAPTAIALDAGGNLYIADRENHRIRRVDASTGIITTVAGDGVGGFSGDGGPAASARLARPHWVALDSGGHLYIAELLNHRIRRVDSATGIITTVAGNGISGFSGDGGPATAASLNMPTGVAVDASGIVFIADHGNNRVRRVEAATGIITTIAGGLFGFGGDGGVSAAARLAFPWGVAVDSIGNLFIADRANHRIRRVALNRPPVANAGPDRMLIVNETGTFDGSASFDPDGTIESYAWGFGDGGSASGAVASHAYTGSGTFIGTLTVTDDQGATGSDTALITVITPVHAIDLLADVVASYNLQQGINNSLDKKLELTRAALDAANAGLRQDAVNKLQSFINEVEAQRGNALTGAQADELGAFAKRIVSVI